MRPIIRDRGKNIQPVPLCGKCKSPLSFRHFINDEGVLCYDPSVIFENFCPNCGEEVEGYKEEVKMNDEERQEYKEEILAELMIRVNNWCRYGRGIDENIIQDMCDDIRTDRNI